MGYGNKLTRCPCIHVTRRIRLHYSFSLPLPLAGKDRNSLSCRIWVRRLHYSLFLPTLSATQHAGEDKNSHSYGMGHGVYITLFLSLYPQQERIETDSCVGYRHYSLSLPLYHTGEDKNSHSSTCMGFISYSASIPPPTTQREGI